MPHTAEKLRTVFKPHPMVPQPFVVKERIQETQDTFTLELESQSNSNHFSFLPGQFNMLYVFGIGEVPISICGDPLKSQTLFHTTRTVGAVTSAMSNLTKGDVLGVRGPFGSSWPLDQAIGKDLVIVGGGIGLAPLRPLLYIVCSRRKDFRKISILYGARTPDDLLYCHELEQWRGRLDLNVYITVDRATSTWFGDMGVVTQLISRASFDPSNTVAMVCGPEIMMRYTVAELHEQGVPDEKIYISMERNMKCAVGFCGHCQYGPEFICKDGPVFPFNRIRKWFNISEL